MKRWMMGLGALGAVAATGFVAHAQFVDPAFAQEGRFGPRHERPMMSPEDRAAFGDARIAALHAGLKLTADQEKMWPPVEDALRGLAKVRQDAMQARRDRYMAMREREERDIPEMLRVMADRQAASAAALGKLADASKPLYASLDEGQKRRLGVLSRGMMMAGMGPHHHRGPEGGPRGREGRPPRPME